MISSPPDSAYIVQRPELMSHLDACMQKGQVYISAPAGFGKSVSARLWLAGRSEARALLTLEDNDNRLPAFAHKLCAAFLELQPDNLSLGEIAGHPSLPDSPKEFVLRAVEALDASGVGILALDDLNRITDVELWKLLSALLKKLPQNIGIMMLSRSWAPEDFAGYMLESRMGRVDMGDLAFKRDEAGALFERSGYTLDDEELDEAVALTCGWPIGLTMLALSYGMPDRLGAMREQLTAYFQTQVWASWPEKLRDMLLSVAPAEPLTAGLCRALARDREAGDMLPYLLRENAFLNMDSEGAYVFQPLFRDFLLQLLDRHNPELKRVQQKKAGDWFFESGAYERAIHFYLDSGDQDGTEKAVRAMFHYGPPFAGVGDALAAARLVTESPMSEKHSFLIEIKAWVAFIEGSAGGMYDVLDRYKRSLPQAVMQKPQSRQTINLLNFMDPRSSLKAFTKGIHILPYKNTVGGEAAIPSFTQNLPLLHRSSRDFSELAVDADEGFARLRKAIGNIAGSGYEFIEHCIRGGLLYEQCETREALECAFSALAVMRDGFAPEMKFCVYMLASHLLSLPDADEPRYLGEIEDMLIRDKAPYLRANLRAYFYRRRLMAGDSAAAGEWLRDVNAAGVGPPLAFFEFYRHFTTARAYLAAGQQENALVFAKKLLRLSEEYRRPLDTIETLTLLSEAYRKIGDDARAVENLERAVSIAAPYRFARAFVEGGATLADTLREMSEKQTANAAYALQLYTLIQGGEEEEPWS